MIIDIEFTFIFQVQERNARQHLICDQLQTPNCTFKRTDQGPWASPPQNIQTNSQIDYDDDDDDHHHHHHLRHHHHHDHHGKWVISGRKGNDVL